MNCMVRVGHLYENVVKHDIFFSSPICQSASYVDFHDIFVREHDIHCDLFCTETKIKCHETRQKKNNSLKPTLVIVAVASSICDPLFTDLPPPLPSRPFSRPPPPPLMFAVLSCPVIGWKRGSDLCLGYDEPTFCGCCCLLLCRFCTRRAAVLCF